MKRQYRIGIMAIAALLLTACGEKEEVVKNQITIASYDAANTASEYVKRGDLDTGETVLFTLEASETMEYTFGAEGLLIDKVYVTEGEEVTKGTLLAELDNETIKLNLKKAKTQKDSVMENITHYTSLLEKEREKNVDKKEEEIRNLDQISRYELKIAELNDDLIIARKKEEEWSAELSKTQIYAGMDGCVEHVGNYGNGITSDEKIPFIKMGTTDRVFTGSIKDKTDYEVGEQIEIWISQSEYMASIVALEEQENETLISVVTDEYVDLTGVNYAEFMWNEEHLEDVLYVPTEAIVMIDGEYYVYVYDENGFPDPVKIRVGKIGSKYTSIAEGVTEGELVELF